MRHFQRDACAFCQERWFRAKDLNSRRVFIFAQKEQLCGFLIAVTKRFGTDHLGHGIRCSLFAANGSEGIIADAGHRRQTKTALQPDAGDLKVGWIVHCAIPFFMQPVCA